MSESTPTQQQHQQEEEQQQHTAAAACSYRYNTEYLKVPGVRFVPTDVELIAYFLRPKLHGQPEVFPAGVVREKEVYHKHPSQLVSELGESLEGSWYCFSTRNRKYRNGKRPSRNTVDEAGFWKAMSKNEDVVDDEKQVVIGQKRALTYHDFADDDGQIRRKKKGHCKKTEWKMVEFVSADSDRPIVSTDKTMLLNDWVLCKITRKAAQGKKKEEEVVVVVPEEEKDPSPCPSQGSSNHVEADLILSPLGLPDDPWLFDDAGNRDLFDEFGSLHSSFGYDGE